jgi:CheY-like chemotaxis protein
MRDAKEATVIAPVDDHRDHSAPRILLVDDHVESVVAGRRLLRALGYDVRVALDGVQALITVATFTPDAALIDLSLPLLDGFDVARQMRQIPQTRDMLLIALTGWATEEHARMARLAGFDLHLVKPVSADTLSRALATARIRPLRPRSTSRVQSRDEVIPSNADVDTE